MTERESPRRSGAANGTRATARRSAGAEPKARARTAAKAALGAGGKEKLSKQAAGNGTSAGRGARATSRASRSSTVRRTRRPVRIEDLLRLRNVSHARLSPDGTRLVFAVSGVGDRNETESNLFMADLRTGGAPVPFTSGGKDSRPQWSPDGRVVAFVSGREKGRPQIALIAADGGEARALTAFPEGSLASFRWSPRGDVLLVSFRPTAPEWCKAAVEARKEQGLSDPPRVLDDPWYRLDGDGYFDAQRFGLYVVDAQTGRHRLVYGRDRLGLFSYDVSPDGTRLVVGTNRHPQAFAKAWTAEIVLVDIASGKVSPVRGLPQGRKDAVSWSPDGRRIAWASIPGDDGSKDGHNVHLFTARPDGSDVRELLAGTDWCLLAPTISDSAEAEFAASYRWAPDGRSLWLQLGWHGGTQIASVPAAGGEVVLHTAGNRQHVLCDVSRDGRALALLVGDASRPPEVHVAEVPAGAAAGTRARANGAGTGSSRANGGAAGPRLSPRAVSDVNGPLLAEIELARPTAHWVRSADGTRVHVWALRPNGAPAKRRRPAVLEIHGGPHTQYGWTYFHEFQVLAAQGYTVFYSNPRGSKGYGQAHCDGISAHWGTRDWEDLQAVLAFMQAQPDVDGRRLGVMGGSFGGYMTLWAVGHSHAFRAAIADRCVSNMVSMWGSSDIYIWPDTYFPGNTWSDTTALWEQSPLRSLGEVRTPVMLIHSEGDLRCNVAESEQVFSALAIRGVPTRFVRYPRNTSHGMSRNGPPDMRIHRLQQIVRWWKEWLG